MLTCFTRSRYEKPSSVGAYDYILVVGEKEATLEKLYINKPVLLALII